MIPSPVHISGMILSIHITSVIISFVYFSTQLPHPKKGVGPKSVKTKTKDRLNMEGVWFCDWTAAESCGNTSAHSPDEAFVLSLSSSVL